MKREEEHACKENLRQGGTSKVKERSPGILRQDSSRSSRLRSTPPLLSPQQIEPSSPQPSVDRLSVTFAIADDNDESSQKDGRPSKVQQIVNTSDSAATRADMQRITIIDGEEEADEEDYSASACAIMQRRSSTRRQSKRRRRPSSPFGTEADTVSRRRSSAHTISSGETAISMEETGNQEQIFEKLKLHKEVLSGVKQQPWSLRRKIKLVRQAKSYVRRHEGVLQERLAQTRSTKDAIARISLFLTKKYQYFRRELVNLQTWLIPWELRIKEIESHFGSAVASYFTFLRWLFWINLVMSATLTIFVAIPEVLTADKLGAGERKIMLREESIKSKHLLTLWEFEGILKYSPFFYGWYTNQDSESGYRLPLAYFVTNLVVYTYSFVAILRKMAENSRLSKLTEKEDECAFSWKLFTGWDFMIGNPETAHNRMASIVLGFKEALLEEAEKEKDERNWKIISMRIFVNVSVISLLVLSAYAVVMVVGRSAQELEHSDWWRQNEITIVMSLITYLFPIFFEILGLLENYHPRKQLRLQLARIMVLNLLNLYSLIFALFDKINSMKEDLDDLKPTSTSCTYKPMKCTNDPKTSQKLAVLASLSLILTNNSARMQLNSGPSEPTLPPGTTKYDNYFLNPLIDNATLEEIYNVGDYSDYTYYGEYEDPEGKALNETIFESKNETAIPDNFTLETFDTNLTSTENVTDSSTEPNDNLLFDSSKSIDLGDTTENRNYAEVSDQTNTKVIETVDVSNIAKEETTSSFSTNTVSSSTMEIISTDSSEITTLPSTMESLIVSTRFGEEETAKNTEKLTTTDTFLRNGSTKRVIPLLEKNYAVKCFEQSCTTIVEDTASSLKQLDWKTRKKLRRLCWETMFGQELAKLTVMDLILTVVSTLGMDFFRALFVRFMNSFWCWDLEKQFPQYGDFKIAENILHLVNNQGMVWMGMFFSPGLTALNLLKLGILMYLRSWAVLTCNVPHEVIFRASRSNNFYFALLLTMLFLCVLPVGYAIVWVEPSWHCGPFSGYQKMYHLATKKLTDSLPEPIQRCLDYIASPGIVIPLIVLMTLIIYYMASLAGSLREANNDLKIQLRHERTEERRKLFKIVEKRQRIMDTTFTRWKHILPHVSSNKLTKMTSSEDEPEIGIRMENITEIEKNGRKPSTTSEGIELTDIEQDSLPHDPTLAQYFSEKVYTEKRPITGISNTRTTSILGDSWESQPSECATIPEIRINEAEGKPEGDPRSLTSPGQETSEIK